MEMTARRIPRTRTLHGMILGGMSLGGMSLRGVLLAATIAFAPVPAVADLESGVAAYQAGNFKEAFVLLEPLAVKGDPQAQFLLGRMYADGQGVLRDYSRAHTWLTLAANQGVGEALYAKTDVAGRMSTRDIIISMERQNAIASGEYKLVSAPAEGEDGAEGEMAMGTGGEQQQTAQGGQQQQAQQQQVRESGAEEAQAAAPADDGIDELPRRELVRAIQEELNRLGFDAGTPDGLYGPSTRSAIQAFEQKAGLDGEGEATPDVLRALRGAREG